MRSLSTRFFTEDQDGLTLVEGVISVLIFVIIMVGGMNYFLQPEAIIRNQKVRRLAIMAAQRKMETMLAMPYEQLHSGLNENGASVKIGQTEFTRTTTITAIDDPADGEGYRDKDGDVVDYRRVVVEISGKPLDNPIMLETVVSRFGQ